MLYGETFKSSICLVYEKEYWEVNRLQYINIFTERKYVALKDYLILQRKAKLAKRSRKSQARK